MRKIVVNLADKRSRWAITDDAIQRIRAALPAEWQMTQVATLTSSVGDGSGFSDEAAHAIADAEIYVGFGFPRELFLAATANGSKLRWVHSGAAGVGASLYPEMIGSDIILTNSAGIHAPPMADTVLAMIFHFARGIDFAVRNQARSAWDQSAFDHVESPVVELRDLAVGILGFGGIGREVARRTKSLGMRVLATRRRPHESTEDAEVIAGDAAGVERVLRESDVVVIALPSTAETRGLIGARELAFMKPSAVIINVARGNIIDENALIDALQRGRIRGAGLDVFEREPLVSDSPLWLLPNTLILPHVSATTTHFWEREAELIVDNFERYLAGRPLRNVVDKTAGY